MTRNRSRSRSLRTTALVDAVLASGAAQSPTPTSASGPTNNF